MLQVYYDLIYVEQAFSSPGTKIISFKLLKKKQFFLNKPAKLGVIL